MTRLCAHLLPLILFSCSMREDLSACEKGDVQACEKNCERGVSGDFGCREAADQLGVKSWREPQKNRKKILTLYEKACAGGDGSGCLAAAFEVSRTSERMDVDRLRSLLSSACELARKGETARLRSHHPFGAESLRSYACGQLGRTHLLSDRKQAEAALQMACRDASADSECASEMENLVALADQLVPQCAAGKRVSEWRPSACGQLRELLDDFTRPQLDQVRELAQRRLKARRGRRDGSHTAAPNNRHP